ncbi:GNAT family N-acetyltransferase [Actinomycetes bacterium KLBMP 9797]
MKIEIGYAVPADVPRLLEIRHAAFAAQAPAVYPPEQVATLLTDIDPDELRRMAAARQLFVARVDGVLVGCAGWRDGRLRHVYVDPDHVRRGVGSALLARVEADFRERTGAAEITAGVVLYAEAFYRVNGYRVVREAAAWDGSLHLEMTKPLA